MTVDLHIHTTCSDGIRTPEQTVAEALQKGLKVISITDHDITTGVKRAEEAAKGSAIEIIPGVEINSFWGKQEIHILGYYIDIDCVHLQQQLEIIRLARENRARQMVEKLQTLQYQITFEEVKQFAGTGAIGRPHIARLLVRKSYFRKTDEVFQHLLSPGGKAYVEQQRISPIEAIAVVKQAGGIPVIAHPGIYHQEIDWEQLIQHGLAGVEVYHTKHTKKDIEIYEAIARQYNLLVTGGSDCHGVATSAIIGTLNIPIAIADRLKEFHSKIFQKKLL